jgi:hypothetical protein
MVSVSYRLPYGRVVQLDPLPKWRRGTLERPWLVLGRMPSSRGMRPTLAAGVLGVVDGRMRVTHGCVSLELLELVRAAVEAAPAGEPLVSR